MAGERLPIPVLLGLAVPLVVQVPLACEVK
jgi:hypothetical protein